MNAIVLFLVSDYCVSHRNQTVERDPIYKNICMCERVFYALGSMLVCWYQPFSGIGFTYD